MQSISGNFATTSAAREAAQPTFGDDSATLAAAQPTLWDDSAALQAPGEAEVLHCRRKSGVQEPRDPHFIHFYPFLFFFIFLCSFFPVTAGSPASIDTLHVHTLVSHKRPGEALYNYIEPFYAEHIREFCDDQCGT